MLAFGFLEVLLGEVLAASPDRVTPPGAGARRDSAAPVLVALLVGILLCVGFDSLPENIGLPSALFGPEELPELLASAPPLLDDDPEPPPDDVLPPELDELEDDVVVVRGTA